MPASYCGVIGFKPTYGRFSRLGLVSYASSLDTIGILGKSINHIENIFQIISVKDPQDMTSQSFSKGTDLLPGSSLRGITVGVPNEYYLEELSNDVVISWSNGIKKLESKGAKIIPISLPSTPKALQSYYIIAPAEASSNLARYDGMRYGYKSENPDLDGLYSATRSEGFGTQVQERIKLGSFVLEADSFNAYFKQAQVVREEVGKDFDRVFRFNNEHGLCDVLITPAAPTTAPRFQDIESESVTEYQNDVMTVPASLAGIPAIVVPFGKGSSDGLPIGLQLLAQKGDDELLFNISRHLLM